MEISRGSDTLNSEPETDRQQATAPESNNSRGWGLSEPILQEPCRVRQDMRLVQRAVKNRWPMKRAKCRGLVDRLFAISEKTAVSVVTRTGDVETIDGPADVHAIAAARVLVSMMGQNQADEHHADDLGKPDASVNVGVQSTSSVTLYLPDNGRDGGTVAMREATPVEVARYALEHEPGYIDYLRQKAMNEGERANGLEESRTCRFAAVVIRPDSTRTTTGG